MLQSKHTTATAVSCDTDICSDGESDQLPTGSRGFNCHVGTLYWDWDVVDQTARQNLCSETFYTQCWNLCHIPIGD